MAVVYKQHREVGMVAEASPFEWLAVECAAWRAVCTAKGELPEPVAHIHAVHDTTIAAQLSFHCVQAW